MPSGATMWCGCHRRRDSASFASPRSWRPCVPAGHRRGAGERRGAARRDAGGLIRRRRALAYVDVSLAAFLHAIGFVGSIAVPRSVDHGIAALLGEAAVVNVVLLGVFPLQHSGSMVTPAGFAMYCAEAVSHRGVAGAQSAISYRGAPVAHAVAVAPGQPVCRRNRKRR